MIQTSFRYIALLLVNFLMIYRFIHFGDYCTNALTDGLIFAFMLLLWIILFLVFYFNSSRRKKQGKGRFDYGLIVFALFKVVTTYYARRYSDRLNHEFPKIILSAMDGKEEWKLILYHDNTCELRNLMFEGICVYKGEYELKENILTLKVSDIEQKSRSKFTSVYELVHGDKEAFPLDSTFDKCRLYFH